MRDTCFRIFFASVGMGARRKSQSLSVLQRLNPVRTNFPLIYKPLA
jgi:hypothetical protein